LDVRSLADSLGYPAAALGILIESAGIPFPGELMLLAVAAWAGAGHLDISLVILCGAGGAVAGADIGWFVGRKGGRPFVESLFTRFRLDASWLAEVELFFARYGDKTILAGRFVLGLRTWASVFAGAAGMPFWRFQLYSVIGAVAWATLYGLLGYFLGSNWPLLERVVRGLGYGGVAVVLLFIVTLLLVRIRARRSTRSRPR
jgi:undecaprenyl-diphosphatase